jgi:hypothetical protein
VWVPGEDDELNQFGFITPIQRDSYSKILSDDTPNPNRYWKPCQHYKRVWLKGLQQSGQGSHIRPLMRSATGGQPYYVCDRRPDNQVSENARNSAVVGKHSPFTLSQPVPGVLAYANTANYSSWGPPGDHIRDFPALMAAQADGGFAADPPFLTDLIDRSLTAMLPGIKAKLSLLNTVIELKDFSSLPKTISKFDDLFQHLKRRISRVHSGKTVFAAIRGSFSRDAGLTLREATNTAADGYLQSEFNVRPLLADISGLWSAMSDTQKQINKLLAGQGRRTVHYFKRKWNLLTPEIAAESVRSSYTLNDPALGSFRPAEGGYAEVGTQFDGYYSPTPLLTGIDKAVAQNYSARRAITLYEGEFNAQIQYSYTFTEHQEKYASILGFLDAVGVNLNPAILWNAIPWSFVVDWVLGVSRWLDQYKTLYLQPDTVIHQYSWSWKIRRMTRLTVEGVSSLHADHLCPRIELPPLYETLYKRVVGVPTSRPLMASGINSRELLLSASLLVPRRWRPNRVSSTRPALKSRKRPSGQTG